MASHFRFKRAADTIASMVDYTLTNTNKINDFTEGSAVQTLYEAFGTEIEQYYYLNVENLKVGIQQGVMEAFGFPRRPQLKAYGSVVVDFISETPSRVIIPKGTRFTSSNSYYTQTFETLDEQVIEAGTATTSVVVYCTQGGTYGNVPAGVIDVASNLSGVAEVYNPSAFQTGQDEETMLEVRRRFRQYIQALQRGTVQALQFGATNVPNVQAAYVDETPGYVRLYVHDANGDLPQRLQIAVQNELIYWRSVGIPVEVFGVHKTIVNLDVTLDVPNPSLQSEALLSEAADRLNKYLNSMKVNQDLFVNDLIQKVMDIDDVGIQDVVVNAMAYPDADLRGDTTVSDINSIIINEHKYPKSMYQPVDRSTSEDYIVSNPEDLDDNEYAEINGDDIKDSTSTTRKPLGSSTTQKPDESKGVTGHGNTLVYPRNTNFALSNPWWDDPSIEPDQQVSENPKPFSIGTIGTLKYFDCALDDSSSMGLLLNNQGDTMIGVRLRLKDGTRYNLTYGADSSKATLDYYSTPTDTDSMTTKTTYIDEKSDLTFQGIEVYQSGDTFYFQDLSTKAKYTVKQSQLSIKEEPVNGQEVVFDYQTAETEERLKITHAISASITSVRYFNQVGRLTRQTVNYVASNGDTTQLTYDEDGQLVRTDVTDESGKVISSTDGGGNSLLTSTTTKKPDSESQTTTIKPDETTTTTTTTAYPFQQYIPVGAEDAPGDGFLPVYSRYTVLGNELIRAGVININYKEVSDSANN
ncbi:hypothetical protein GPK34_00720 [Secundilactobacillus kimchicus]|uniref:baseplate J/gp47 family protein n=1 Tax=Secundilactobacillus kimchicus TaxID=528209 RepID=UPI001C0197E8|nr:baseplate J/gp47 family protein [Secundilactobacillus kimchicus]MBT9670561.1 hypothetical protein [Secundilactobacillus kimchicus]